MREGKKSSCNLGRFFTSSEDLFFIKTLIANADGDSSSCTFNFTVNSKLDSINTKDLESKSSNFAKTGDFEEFNDISSLLVDLLVSNQVRYV